MTRQLLILAVAAALSAPAMQQPDAAALALESAKKKETVSGDMEGAIRQYREVAAKYANRPAIAAQALVALGQCYERLGSSEARKAYERVVKEFGGEAQAAGTARARLAAMGGGAAEPRARLLWDNATDIWGTVSADGRYLSFVDWSSGDLAVRDLVAGTNRRVTDKGGYSKALAEAEASAMSPDGKRIAFAWDRWDETAKKEKMPFELRVIGSDGTGEQVLLRTAKYVEPHSWSPDGKWIATSVQSVASRDTDVTLVSTVDGATRVLPVRLKQWKDRITFSPDGQWLAFSSETAQGSGRYLLYTLKADGSAAAESEVAADASMVAWTPDGGGILFFRQRDGVSALYVLPVLQGKPAGEARPIRTAPLPKGKALGMTARGGLIFASHEVRMDAWVSEFDVRTGRLGKRLVQFPAERIGVMMMTSALKFSPDGKEFFCGAAHKGIRIRSMATGQERVIMPQLSQMVRADWAPDGKSLLVVGTGDDGRRGLYRVDLHTGDATFLAEIPSESFMILSCGDGKTFYYADRQRRIIQRDAATGADKVLLDDPAKLGDAAIQAEPSQDMQKLGIRGKDYLGVLDLATGQVRDVYLGKSADAPAFRGLDWSADGQYLVTILRPDPKVQSTEIRAFPVNGGAPVVTKTPVELRGLSVSADGKHIGSVSYSNLTQVWTLENFLPSSGK